MENLSTWANEIESVIKTDSGYRCYTDINHGFYFDIINNEAITMDNEKLIDDINISLLISDFVFLS